MVEPDKGKLFRDGRVPMAQAIREAIKTIQNSSFKSNSFFYNVLKKDCRSEPRVRTLCMVVKKGLGDHNRFGVVVSVAKSSVWVKFLDGTQKFANDAVVLLMRPPKETEQELDNDPKPES